MKNELNQLIIHLVELLKSKDKNEIKRDIIKVLPKVYFGMDSDSEKLTKEDIINDINSYIENENMKTVITIRISFLTQLLNNA